MIINKEQETDSVIIFLHIPKTGGSTLHSIINEQYKDYCDIKLPLWGKRRPQNLSIEQKKRTEVLRGHFSFGIHKLLPQKKYTYITILRNPIERVISAFYFIRREKNKDSYLQHLFNQMSLYDFVTKKEFNYYKGRGFSTVNLQTRKLAGKIEDDLETAKNNLEKYFSIVGITERFDDTLCVIEKKLGWKIDNYSKKNVTPNKPPFTEIPDEIIEIIKRKNKKDIELYQFANKLLNKQLQQLKD